MKLLRHGPVGAEKPGAIDANGLVRDLSLLMPDLTSDWLEPAKLRAISAIALEHMPLVRRPSRAPVDRTDSQIWKGIK